MHQAEIDGGVVLGELDHDAAASFDVEGVFRRETDGVQTATMTARMALLKR